MPVVGDIGYRPWSKDETNNGGDRQENTDSLEYGAGKHCDEQREHYVVNCIYYWQIYAHRLATRRYMRVLQQ